MTYRRPVLSKAGLDLHNTIPPTRTCENCGSSIVAQPADGEWRFGDCAHCAFMKGADDGPLMTAEQLADDMFGPKGEAA